MGQKLFNYISGQCDTLAATSSPGIDTIGLHIILALATIMMVWFGVQEALSAAQGGPGFNMAKFLNFFLLITFAYSMVKFYDSSIPGLGFSLKSFVIQGTDNLQQIIGTDANDQMLASIDNALAGSGTSTPTLNIFSGLYVAVCYVMAQLCLIVLDAVCALILSYGAVAGTIVGMLGPIFIPFMVFEKTEFLFWGWLKSFLSFEFFKVVAAATLSLVAHMYMSQATNVTQIFSDPVNAVKAFPILLLLTIVSVYIILKIPAITVSIFSGSAAWDKVTIENVRLGQSTLVFSMIQGKNFLDLDIQNQGVAASVSFNPQIPLGSSLLASEFENKRIQASVESAGSDQHARMTLKVPPGKSRLHLSFTGGVTVSLGSSPLVVGAASTSAKLVDVHLEGKTLKLDADVHPRHDAIFTLRTPWTIEKTSGAAVRLMSDGEYEVRVAAPFSSAPGYTRAQVSLLFKEK